MWKPITIGSTLHHHIHTNSLPNKSRETISCSFIKSLGPLLKISMKWQPHVHGLMQWRNNTKYWHCSNASKTRLHVIKLQIGPKTFLWIKWFFLAKTLMYLCGRLELLLRLRSCRLKKNWSCTHSRASTYPRIYCTTTKINIKKDAIHSKE